MKRVLAASVAILLTGWSPASAADGNRLSPAWSSRVPDRHFSGHRQVHHRVAPDFVWVGHWHDPLWSWDDGFFSDLKYRHYDRYGHWPYRRDRRHPSGEVEVVNDEARYYYDRGYPYRRYDYGRPGDYAWHEPGYERSASVRCRTQRVWSDEDRKEVPVRICSN